MNQTLLRINLPRGVRVYPSAFREALARESDLPPAFFHRKDGKTINARPTIRTAGTRNWVGLVADGEESRQLLYQAVEPAMKIVNRLAGAPCFMEIENLNYHLASRQTPQRYFLREIVIKQRSKIRRTAPLEDVIKGSILQSIRDTCAQMEWDCPEDEDLGVIVKEVTHARGMLLQTTTGVTKESVGLFDAEILIHAELKGIWFLGNLTSRGYGMLIKPYGGKVLLDKPRETDVLQ